jgi:hypothetical protein
MSHELLILRHKAIISGRWLRANFFTLFVLGPMIVFGFYYILKPSLVEGAAWVRRQAGAWTPGDLEAVSLGLAMVLVAVSLSSAMRAVYALSSADVYLDALPVRPMARFHVLAVSQSLSKLTAWVVLLVVGVLLGGSASAGNAASLLLVLVQLALLEIAAVLALVHFRSFRAGRLLLLGAAFVLLALAGRQEPLIHLALLPLLPAASLLEKVLFGGLVSASGPANIFSQTSVQIVSLAALYGLAAGAFAKWRDADREHARESAARRRVVRMAGSAFLARRLGAAMAAQIIRDWRLTRRVFSPAVYVTGGFAALFLLLPVLAFPRWNLDPAWTAKGIQVCASFGALSLAALAPLLLQYELRYLWPEQSAGVDPQTIWRAKVWYACLLVAPVAALATLTALWQVPMGMAEAALFIVKLVLICCTVASLIGAIAFESVASPVLGLLFSGLFAMGTAGTYIFTDLWPVWAFLHVYVMHGLYERADARSDTLGAEL